VAEGKENRATCGAMGKRGRRKGRKSIKLVPLSRGAKKGRKSRQGAKNMKTKGGSIGKEEGPHVAIARHHHKERGWGRKARRGEGEV